jgi:hypothetical protein
MIGEEVFVLRRLGVLLGILALSSLPGRAQENVQVFGGYSYMRFGTSPAVNLNGWEISGQYKFTDWVGAVADFDGHYGTVAGVGNSVYTYLFGPQVSFPTRVSPFARVLLGGAHFGAQGFGKSSFSIALGAGIDAELTKGIAWRLFQGDYLVTDFGSRIQHNVRVSTGIVFRF